jgi:RNA polymerase sigma factor for flagellar operon FliA
MKASAAARKIEIHYEADEASRQTQTSGVSNDRDRIVLEHMPLVNAIARSIRANLPASVEFDDLVQAGIVGLVNAASKFDESKQLEFPTYAKHRIRGAMLDSLREMDWASRDTRRRKKQVENASRELTAVLQRAPTESEMAGKLGVGVDEFRKILQVTAVLGPVSTSIFSDGEDENARVLDLPTTPDTQPEALCAGSELRGKLRQTLRTLPPRYQKVIALYYDDDRSMREIGRELGVHESRVSQVHKAALAKMALALNADGIRSSQRL